MSSHGVQLSPRWRVALVAIFVLIVTMLGALQCRAWNGAPNADGISYLELAHGYAEGRFGVVANGYWSPLYPALLGIALRVSGAPSLHYADTLAPELRVVLVVNLLILAAATFCFARLVAVLDDAEPSPPPAVRVCRALAAGSLWIWCSIRLVGATTITPDLLLGAWLSLATTELAQLRREPLSRNRAIRLGAVLGLAYWTKAVFFPLAIVGLVAGILLARAAARRRGAAWLAGTTLALCAPLFIIQSLTQRHVTFGETGRLNYQWYVNDVPRLEQHAGALDAATASAGNDVERLADGSVLLQGDAAGSFPYWYDPTRFTRRAPIVFSSEAQLRTARANGHWYRVVAGTLALLCLAATGAAALRQRIDWSRSIVAAPVLTLLVLHGLTHPEGRLVGAGLATTLVLLLHPGGALRVAPLRSDLVRVSECVLLAMVVVIALGRASNRISLDRRPVVHNLAGEVARQGLRAGESVGVLGSPYGHYWAHQAGLRIVLLAADPATSGAVSSTDALASRIAGACARGVPISAMLWRDDRDTVAPDVARLSGTWKLWKPRVPCSDATIVAR